MAARAGPLMALPPVYGHEEARLVLGRAAAAATLPHSLLLHGPAGLGKERLGLWIAELLLCEAEPELRPCAACRTCRLVRRLEHPDVHWFFPLPRPEGASAERLRDKLEDARAAELAAFRADPLHQPRFERAPAYFLASIQVLQQLAGVRPAMGRQKVFVVGDAERMVPQESSPEAANAFLKLLEEPPVDTMLVLTSAQPGGLLPTIRSRVLPLRLAPHADAVVERFLREVAGLDDAAAATAAAHANGSVGRAIRLVPGADGGSAWADGRRAARALLEAALVDSAAPRLSLAHAQAASGARNDLPLLLDALGAWLRDLMAVAAGADDLVGARDGAELLHRVASTRRIEPIWVADALDRVDEAQTLAQGNVNPQLVVAELLRSMQTALRGGR